jgi:6-phosphogluconolactonase
MGLGPDGHTASLFPSKPEWNERGRFVVAVPEAGMAPQIPRVSMTLPVFNAAAKVVFIVAGKDKAKAMRRAFGDPPDATAPAAHVRPEHGELIVLCDEAAAAEL